MTKDLEATLEELGPGYRAVVDRLVAAYRPPADATARRVGHDRASAANLERLPRPSASRGHIFRWTAAYLVAASLLVCVGLGVLFRADLARMRGTSTVTGAQRVYTAAYAADAASLRAIVAAQRADGSWQNDFLTRQNAAALRGATEDRAQIAYKKAVRYLRAKGLSPLTDEELRVRGLLADRARSRQYPMRYGAASGI